MYILNDEKIKEIRQAENLKIQQLKLQNDKNRIKKILIEKYTMLVYIWNNDNELKQMLPETYRSIVLKLKLLNEQKHFEITDKTNELKNMIAYIGGQIPRVNFTGSKKGDKLINKNNGITWKGAKTIANQSYYR